MVITFRLNLEDEDIKDLLKDCKTNKEKTDKIKKILRWYMENNKNNDTLKDIKKEIKRMGDILTDIISNKDLKDNIKNSNVDNHFSNQEENFIGMDLKELKENELKNKDESIENKPVEVENEKLVEALVKNAEETKNQNDINNAKEKVNQLQPGIKRNEFDARLNKIQEEIDKTKQKWGESVNQLFKF